jgi:hypothetical protein
VVAAASGIAGYLLGSTRSGGGTTAPADAAPAEPPSILRHPSELPPPPELAGRPPPTVPSNFVPPEGEQTPKPTPKFEELVTGFHGDSLDVPGGRLVVVLRDGDHVLVRDGPWRELGPDGRLLAEGEYREGAKVGRWTTYHPNGRVDAQEEWHEGKKHGTWLHHDAEGRLVRRATWEGGNLAAPIELWDPGGVLPPEGELLRRASVEGKYAWLLLRIAAPDDRATYGDFRDFGTYRETDYLGHRGVPAGYWVYVHPFWFVWRDRIGE